MDPIDFPEKNVTWAENQPEFRPLPAYTSERETITCWKLTWRERFALLWRGELWLRQMNFGAALQAQLPSVECPFIRVQPEYAGTMTDEGFTPRRWWEWYK